MTITHHPDDSTLMSYAAGSLPEPLSAVVLSHLSLCPHCRAEVREMECLGSALIETVAPAELEAPVPAPAGRDHRFDMVARRAWPSRRGELPDPIAKFAGASLDRIEWKRLGPGVWHLPLPLSKGVKGDLRLLKVAPGQAMPDHGHGGAELTLVLRGSYDDAIGCFAAGDVADLDEANEHQPVANRETGCICLIASVEKARFKSLIARLVQPLTGF